MIQVQLELDCLRLVMLSLVSLRSKFKRFRVAGWVAGKAENIDQLSPAKLELGLGLSLATIK